MTNEHVVQCLSHGGYFHLWLCILALKAGIKICLTENISGTIKIDAQHRVASVCTNMS